jgi:hypothetical protein
MVSRRTIVLAMLGITVLWGFGAAVLTHAAGWSPVVAFVFTLVPIAGFGWLSRGREVVEVVLPAYAIAYAGYIGLALARVAQPNTLASRWHIVLADQWPLVIVGGIPVALTLAVVVALPFAVIGVRTPRATETDPAFWRFVESRNRARDERVRVARRGL